jgi:glutathione peroxidase
MAAGGAAPSSLFDFAVKSIRGEEVALETLRGKHDAFLVVNVASKCGLTDRNYKELSELHAKYGDKIGLLLFPCNQVRATPLVARAALGDRTCPKNMGRRSRGRAGLVRNGVSHLSTPLSLRTIV